MIVGDASEVAEGRAKCYIVEGMKIAVFQAGGEFYALDDRCSHADASLSDGWVDGKCVACPWHGAQFSLETGDALSPPAYGKVNTYPVTVIDGKIDVTVTKV